MFLKPTTNFRFRNAKEFVESAKSGDLNLYAFVSRSYPWEIESEPPIPVLSNEEQQELWDDMMLLRRIQPTDVVPGIRRIPWQRDSVYQEFDDRLDLQEEDFYIFTQPEGNIYLCIDNNNDSPSTQKPTHRDENVVEESDGYKWKYMTTISTSLINKFLLNDYVPFESNEEIIESSTPGTIEHLKVENSGSGYPANASIGNSNELPVFIQGNGTQVSTATAAITVIQGSIRSINLTSSGNDYFYGPGVEFPVAIRQVTTNGTVQNAYGVATTNLDGEIDSVSVIIGGSGYQPGSVSIVQSSGEGYAETNASGEVINAEMRIGRFGNDFFKASAIIVSESGSGGSLIPTVSPKGGFGVNQEKQLHSHYALISLEVDADDVLSLATFNEFRQIGIISDPLEYSNDPLLSDGSVDSDGGNTYESDGTLSGTPLSISSADAKHRIELTGTNQGFIENETIVGETSGTIGLNAVRFNTDTLRLSIDDSIISEDDVEFEIGEQIRGLSSGTTAIVSSFTRPDVEKYSGEIYHINNIEPIIRNDDQRILVTFALKY
jgi:hypothetical protein